MQRSNIWKAWNFSLVWHRGKSMQIHHTQTSMLKSWLSYLWMSSKQGCFVSCYCIGFRNFRHMIVYSMKASCWITPYLCVDVIASVIYLSTVSLVPSQISSWKDYKSVYPFLTNKIYFTVGFWSCCIVLNDLAFKSISSHSVTVLATLGATITNWLNGWWIFSETHCSSYFFFGLTFLFKTLVQRNHWKGIFISAY